MVREGSSSPIGMTIKDVASFLPNFLKTKIKQKFFHDLEVNDW
jgi:hypothetical protein